MNKVIKAIDGKIMFKCPGCDKIHSITEIIWEFNGDLKKPTIKPSIKSTWVDNQDNTDICHSFVTNGEIRFLNDSTHDLAGQTVKLFPINGEYYNMELVQQIERG